MPMDCSFSSLMPNMSLLIFLSISLINLFLIVIAALKLTCCSMINNEIAFA